MVNQMTDDKKEDLKTTCMISKFLYEKILKAIEDILPILKDGLKKI